MKKIKTAIFLFALLLMAKTVEAAPCCRAGGAAYLGTAVCDENPDGVLMMIVCDDNLGATASDEWAVPEPPPINPERFEVIKGDDPARESAVEAACNNSCDIYLSGSEGDMTDGDVMVVTNNTGLKRIWGDDGDGYRCLVGCEELPPPNEQPPLENPSEDATPSADAPPEDYVPPERPRRETIFETPPEEREETPPEHVPPPNGECAPGIGLRCWSDAGQLCRCGGGGDLASKGAEKKCEPNSVCVNNPSNSIEYYKKCGLDSGTTWWIPLETVTSECLSYYRAEDMNDPLQAARQVCEHLDRGFCANDRCMKASCELDKIIITPLYDWPGGGFLGYCKTCRE